MRNLYDVAKANIMKVKKTAMEMYPASNYDIILYIIFKYHTELL